VLQAGQVCDHDAAGQQRQGEGERAPLTHLLRQLVQPVMQPADQQDKVSTKKLQQRHAGQQQQGRTCLWRFDSAGMQCPRSGDPPGAMGTAAGMGMLPKA
jgi:hypothetical protein